MTEIEIKDIAIIIGGAITAISTLCAVLITSRFNLKLVKINIDAQAQQKNEERKIQKIEDMYLLFEKWETNFSNIYLMHLRCYCGKLDYKSVMELTKDSAMFAPGDFQKLKMLMNVHFPEIASEHKKVDDARRKIAPFLSDPKESKLNPKDFVKLQEDFETVCATFKMQISNLANKAPAQL